MQQIVDKHCFQIPTKEVLSLFGVEAEKGLDSLEVERRREQFGRNVLTERKGRHPLVHFLLQFHQPLVYILLAAMVVTLFLREYVDSMVIFGVVLINAVVGFIQEAKALKAIQALSKALSSNCTVLRAGRKEVLASSELVPGDIVFLQSGDKVPADLRLIRQRDLQINESALTGESVSSHKGTDPLPKDTPLGDRANMAFSSTLVTYGAGTGVVATTGDSTEVGRISEMIATAEVLATPLTRKIHGFANLLLFVIIGLAGLVVLAGLYHRMDLIEIFMAAVAMAVGAIPEGLPAAVTIIMAIGVSRMAARRTIIRRLPAVETLGSTTVICSDKTGTLTQNQMTVLRAFSGGQLFEITGSGYAPEGDILKNGAPVDLASEPHLEECLKCGLLCSDAEISESEGLWVAQGDPTEGALVSAAWKAGMTPQETRQRYPRMDAIPFESQHQFMATMHDMGQGKHRKVYVKGSLESLITRCRAAAAGDGEARLDADAVRREAEAMASRGLRVLALAGKEMPRESESLNVEDVSGDLVFLGLQGMMDPPRPEAGRAVAACQRAGIRIKMITGDHALTAASIAKEIGIDGSHSEDGTPIVMTGKDIESATEAELIDRVENVAVFARVSPEHKLRLVEALQARGHVVAMTGDGVNDAPALKRANIGVAMALAGTQVAREASDMVLTDDNFASIEAAVEEGRGVFDNLRKFIVWTLPTNGAEGLVILVAVLLGLSLPMLPVQILWVNMMTAVCLGMMLAFEPKERGIMEQPPNDPKMPILTPMLIWRIVLVSGILCAAVFGVFKWELLRGSTLGEARTSAVTMLVFGELFYLFNCRSLTHSFVSVGLGSNPWIWLGVSTAAVLQILFTHFEPMGRLFHAEPISLHSWAVILGLSLLISMIVGVEKALRLAVARRRR